MWDIGGPVFASAFGSYPIARAALSSGRADSDGSTADGREENTREVNILSTVPVAALWCRWSLEPATDSAGQWACVFAADTYTYMHIQLSSIGRCRSEEGTVLLRQSAVHCAAPFECIGKWVSFSPVARWVLSSFHSQHTHTLTNIDSESSIGSWAQVAFVASLSLSGQNRSSAHRFPLPDRKVPASTGSHCQQQSAAFCFRFLSVYSVWWKHKRKVCFSCLVGSFLCSCVRLVCLFTISVLAFSQTQSRKPFIEQAFFLLFHLVSHFNCISILGKQYQRHRQQKHQHQLQRPNQSLGLRRRRHRFNFSSSFSLQLCFMYVYSHCHRCTIHCLVQAVNLCAHVSIVRPIVVPLLLMHQ